MVRSGWIRSIAALAAFYGIAIVLGFGLFVAAMTLGLFANMSILFYRGLAVLAAITPLLVLLLWLALRLPWSPGLLGARDAVAAAIVAISVNVAAFVLGPITVDRSISVFMLSRLAAAPAPLSADDLTRAFATQYVRDWDQIGRRLKEQVVSRNVEQTPDGRYRLTPQGRSFMTTAQAMSRLFGGDPRFVGLDPQGR